MSLISVVTNYRNAVSAARTRGATLPLAAYSVLRARLRYGLGPVLHSFFELDTKPDSEWKDYVRSWESNSAQGLLSDQEGKRLTKDKLAFAVHCAENGLPTISVVCIIDKKPNAQSSWFLNCVDLDSWFRVINDAPSRLFLKPIDGIHGDGAFSARREGDVWHFGRRSGSAAELHKYCLETIHGNRGWIVQPEIAAQSELRRRVAPNGLCTIRIFTYMSGESCCTIPFAVLKIPTGGNQTDNFSMGYGGNLVAPIDLATGELGRARGSRSSQWPVMFATDEHPDTGQRITGFTVPYWQDVLRLAHEGQRLLPQVPTLGWDIAVTDNGSLIIETNWDYGVELIQVAFRRGIRRDLAPTLRHQSESRRVS